MSDRLHAPANAFERARTLWRLRWLSLARAKQLPPPGDWNVWTALAGRGFGKTRVASEWLGGNAADNPGTRWLAAGPTQNDVRAVMFEGESGLLAVIPPSLIAKYSKTELEIHLTNGSMIGGRSAEKPDRFRGVQWHGAALDELAAWGASTSAKGATKTGIKEQERKIRDAWDNIRFSLRLGKHPQILVTTTPRPLPFLRALNSSAETIVVRGTSFENAENLSANTVAAMRELYEGTRIGRQELYAEILDDVEGALWSRAMIAEARTLPDGPPSPDGWTRTVVAVDPAVTSTDNSDEWGVVVASRHEDGNVYIRADFSGRYTPRQAARVILQANERFGANAIVAEVNQGGDLIEELLRSECRDEDYSAAYSLDTVRAKVGKYLRAEPVSAYYEKGKVKHVGRLDTLEDQMCEFTGSTSDGSPDRVDALVYAIGALMQREIRHAFF